MQNRLDRAKQFLSFDALSGYKGLINKNNFKNNRDSIKILSDDRNDDIDKIMRRIGKDFLIRIKYYDGDNYIESSGRVKKIDTVRRKIYFLRSVVDIDNIIDIEIIDSNI